VLLAAGINDGVVDADLARAPDVGVSYGLAAVTAVLVGRVPRRHRPWYALGVLAVAGGTLLADRDFTGVGHVTAVLLGFALAVLATRRDRPEQARA
jgi:hypothetical protein